LDKLFFEDAPVPMLVIDRQGKILHHNNKAQSVFSIDTRSQPSVTSMPFKLNDGSPAFHDSFITGCYDNPVTGNKVEYEVSHGFSLFYSIACNQVKINDESILIFSFFDITEFVFFEKQSDELIKATIKQDSMLNEARQAYELLGDILWEKFFYDAPESYIIVNEESRVVKVNKKSQELFSRTIPVSSLLLDMNFLDKQGVNLFSHERFEQLYINEFENIEISFKDENETVSYFLVTGKSIYLEERRLLFLTFKNVTEIVFFENIFEKQYDDFVTATNKLDKMIAELKKAYALLQQKDDEIIRQLYLAREIQNNIFSLTKKKIGNYSIYSRLKAASIISGDFFTMWERDNNKLDIVIADVTGHGVASALITMMLKMALETRAKDYYDPIALIAAIRADLHPILSKSLLFLTILFSRIDLESGTISSVDCGHVPPVILKKSGEVVHPEINGVMLGVKNEFEYDEYTSTIEPGDLVLFLTDGILEARNSKGEFFEDYFFTFLSSNRELNPDDLIKQSIDELTRFTGKEEFDDDVTIICIKRDC
jgi:serine phosphatase RsbU (regulator of sigma subunit)